MPSPYSFRCKADGDAELLIYDVIDPYWGISAKQIADDLKAAKDAKTIRVRINSPGGSIIEGTAIHNLLRRHSGKKIVTVDGMAASMASVVAMAGDEIEMGEGSYIMIHNPLGFVYGTAEDMQDYADLLSKMKDQLIGIYAKRTGQSPEDLSAMMDAETWMTPAEAIDKGFADWQTKGLAVAAQFDLSRFGRVPAVYSLRNQGATKMADTNETPKPATLAELKAACVGADPAFLVAQMELAATAAQASVAWSAEQIKRAKADADAARAEAAAAKAEVEAMKAKTPTPAGALGTRKEGGKTADDNGDPVAKFNSLVASFEAKGMKRPKAISAAVKHDPQLHRDYIQAWNERHPQAHAGRE